MPNNNFDEYDFLDKLLPTISNIVFREIPSESVLSHIGDIEGDTKIDFDPVICIPLMQEYSQPFVSKLASVALEVDDFQSDDIGGLSFFRSVENLTILFQNFSVVDIQNLDECSRCMDELQNLQNLKNLSIFVPEEDIEAAKQYFLMPYCKFEYQVESIDNLKGKKRRPKKRKRTVYTYYDPY